MKLSKLATPKTVLKFLSYWPPFYFSGIKVESVNNDLTYVKVRLKAGTTNKNYKGTHFGGSLYAMVDPFYMFMVMQQLGNLYIVWDYAAHIEFIKATSSEVYAEFHLTQEQINQIIIDAEKSKKIFPEFIVEIKSKKDHELIARVKKVLYVRKKRL